ncbi:zinc-ribbon domain-containing protein, partial [Gordonibacter pamelaeae]|uniref:zinc-ribbon domain-containing protein n=1 Tax=Gordonibacter pamelaeae TaxID=471189 RepID=UPI0012EA6753
MICPNCRSENKEGAKFCNECGFPLTGRMAAVAAASTSDDTLRSIAAEGAAAPPGDA